MTEDSLTAVSDKDTTSIVAEETKIHVSKSMTIQTEEFETFFDIFSTDSLFQKSKIRFPFPEIFYDIEDNQTIDSLKPSDWTFLDLKYDSTAYYRQIDAYEQIFEISSDKAKVGFRGIDNGIYFDYIFERLDSTWQLVKYVDYSN